ncbi:MAG: transporter [Omnitrophica WOR_2 bacterium RIFCSPHIGHO2_02_FULL_52_10]|nr:MAG: transporter [Omnitrophica WOR_2 bacterium RIFCSPHIGHO2_02_FULL_52_10]
MANSKERLARKLNTADAVVIGLGAMIGSGIFVAISPAVASAGSGILLGLFIAAIMAYCNATSSGQLAAVYPESGGTYVYGRERLGRLWGWLAGWGFVIGKIASCAAAALTFGYYVYAPAAKYFALLAVAGLTVANYRGIEKTLAVTRIIVFVVLSALFVAVFASLGGGNIDSSRLVPFSGTGGLWGILQAAGILFFAFAGYARIATLGEEIREPRKAIPKAMMVALLVTLFIYFTVIAGALLAAGPEAIAQSHTPLVTAVEAGSLGWISPVVRLGAIVASVGVLLSLMLGISRTLFSMAGNKELPVWLAGVHPKFKVPHHAEVTVALVIGMVVMLWDVRSAIGFSAFTILIYYAITNASAWTLSKEQRLWPRWLSVLGMAGCILLAFSLPRSSVLAGGIVMAAGFVMYGLSSGRMKT